MLPHRVPRPCDDTAARAHLRANVQAAAAAGSDPGRWELHHTALPGDGPGDFTPYRAPEYAEDGVSPAAGLLERLAELLGPDHARIIAERGIEAGQ